MAHTHTLRRSVSWTDGKNIYSQDFVDVQTGGTYTYIKEVIPDGSTDLRVTFELTLTELLMILIKADGPLTLETNSGVSPTDTFALSATNWLQWSADNQSGEENGRGPITGNINTDVFATNSSGGDVTLEILCLTDATP